MYTGAAIDHAATARCSRVSPAAVPPELRYAPFRGSAAIARGLLTRSQLAGPAWRRTFRCIYQHADATADLLAWCQAASLLLPLGAALSHRSAALLYGVNLLPHTSRPIMEITVPAPGRLRPAEGLVVIEPAWTRLMCYAAAGSP